MFLLYVLKREAQIIMTLDDNENAAWRRLGTADQNCSASSGCSDLSHIMFWICSHRCGFHNRVHADLLHSASRTGFCQTRDLCDHNSIKCCFDLVEQSLRKKGASRKRENEGTQKRVLLVNDEKGLQY